MKKSNPKALMPIGVFLVLYLGLGIVFEYVMKIPMGILQHSNCTCIYGGNFSGLFSKQGSQF